MVYNVMYNSKKDHWENCMLLREKQNIKIKDMKKQTQNTSTHTQHSATKARRRKKKTAQRSSRAYGKYLGFVTLNLISYRARLKHNVQDELGLTRCSVFGFVRLLALPIYYN